MENDLLTSQKMYWLISYFYSSTVFKIKTYTKTKTEHKPKNYIQIIEKNILGYSVPKIGQFLSDLHLATFISFSNAIASFAYTIQYMEPGFEPTTTQ